MLFYEYKNVKISLKTQGTWRHINKSKEEVHLRDGMHWNWKNELLVNTVINVIIAHNCKDKYITTWVSEWGSVASIASRMNSLNFVQSQVLLLTLKYYMAHL